MSHRNRHTPGRRWLAIAATAALLAGVTTVGSAASAPVADDIGAETVADGRVLYSPPHPTGDGSYPRVIRLEQADNTGNTLLATYFAGSDDGPGRFPIHRSTDGGQTWTQLTTITSNTPGWDIGAPVLYEVPRTANGLNAGDLLASGTAWEIGDFSAQKVEVFKSTDQGETWEYLSSCTETSGLPNTIGHGVWEPWFLLADDNTLACFLSDERPAFSPTNNQVIGHYTSTDGGQTWSEEMTLDVAFPNDEMARPGMSIITALPNGNYLMAYELCRDATDPDHACEVYTKTSRDGLNWGRPSARGNFVQTADGRHLLHTPYVAWSPAGGRNGTLLMSGQRVVTGPTGQKTVMPESGKVLFANTSLGRGDWHEIAAPISVDPTGSYNGPPSCPGYSTPILPSVDGEEILLMAGTLRGPEHRGCEVRYGFASLGSLPASLPYTPDVKEGFAEYGGTWEATGDTLSVTDEVSGSKVVTGSEAWTNYTLTGQVRLDAEGQAGFLLRLSSPDVGADAHRGYYVGIETTAGQLVVGKQDYNWEALVNSPMIGGVEVGAWYEITVTAKRCTLTVTAQRADGSIPPTQAEVTDRSCFKSGAIALRSHFTPASWRAVQVTP